MTITVFHLYNHSRQDKMTEWNMRTTSTTQPINILASNDEYGESGVDHHRNHFNDNDDLDVEFNNLTVGSLPSIRRERRLIVSSGNHEFISNGATNAGQRSPSLYRRRHSGTSFRGAINALNNSNNSNRRRQHSDSSAVHRMAIASSMPVPSAPFLASRNDQASGDRLSRYGNTNMNYYFIPINSVDIIFGFVLILYLFLLFFIFHLVKYTKHGIAREC